MLSLDTSLNNGSNINNLIVQSSKNQTRETNSKVKDKRSFSLIEIEHEKLLKYH